jgi:dihydrofolate reductase
VALKTSVYIATSLDGFIARTNGDLDWLTGDHQTPGEDYGYQAFIDTVDVIVMGRHTFEQVLTFDHWPYPSQKVIVLSSRAITIPPELADGVEHASSAPDQLLSQLADRGFKHVYVDGGKTIQRFLDAHLIDELIITRIPILIGEGIPLFGPVRHDIRLHHVETRQFANGFVQSQYTIPGNQT